jgi:hypothetical protein
MTIYVQSVGWVGCACVVVAQTLLIGGGAWRPYDARVQQELEGTYASPELRQKVVTVRAGKFTYAVDTLNMVQSNANHPGISQLAVRRLAVRRRVGTPSNPAMARP